MCLRRFVGKHFFTFFRNEDTLCEDYCTLGPKEVFSWLTRVMYNRRCEFNPLLNTAVVAGFRNGEAFCGFVDSVGTHFEVKGMSHFP